tara:strand:+ start:377 stop:721 length:345 start_codon:yes stop_codon:yes gene_type:complete
MKGETYIYAVNALAGADDGGVWKASDLMSVEIASASTVEFRFKAGNDAAGNGVVTLTLPANLGTENRLVFKTICKKISGMLNRAKGDLFILADEINSLYMEPFTGAVVIDDVNV